MVIEHLKLSQINGSLAVIDGVKNASYEEMATLRSDDGTERTGRVICRGKDLQGPEE